LLCRCWVFHMACFHILSTMSFYTQYPNHSTCPFQVRGKLFPFWEIFFWQGRWRGGSQPSCHQSAHSPHFHKGVLAFIDKRVMIDYKARPNFQGETWTHLKFTWFHVALQTETWTRFLESLAEVHELLWQTRLSFMQISASSHTDWGQFSHDSGSFSISGGKWQKWVLFSLRFSFVLKEFGFNS
jgi:hypothetical protein